MKNRKLTKLVLAVVAMATTALLTAGCGNEKAPVEQTAKVNMPTPNPWLTQSAYPTAHINSAQTIAVEFAGPSKGRALTASDIKTVPTVWTSDPTVKMVGKERIIFGCGVNGIKKIIATGESFEEHSFLPYPGFEDVADKGTPEAIAAALDEANAAYRANDNAKIVATAQTMDELGFDYTTITNGIYNFIDKDGFVYAVYGGVNIIKATDDNDPQKPVRLVKTKNLTEGLPTDVAQNVTRIVGLGMTYDGNIAAAAPGAIFLVDRDLNLLGYLKLDPGEAVDNSIAIDEDGIYVVTSTRMLKLVWTGKKLSIEESDGGWASGYDWMSDDEAEAVGALSRGSGTTPTLMGFGDDKDKLVLISDGARDGAKLVAFWRDKIPEDFEQKPGTKSRRIADQIQIDISKLTVECSFNVLGYGVGILNGSYPQSLGKDLYSSAMTGGTTRPAPTGVQKFAWDLETRSFRKEWTNMETDNSDLIVPVLSARTGMLYLANKENGRYEMVALDWKTGKIQARWPAPDDSRKWNTSFTWAAMLDDGDFLLGGFFTIKRVNVGDGKQ